MNNKHEFAIYFAQLPDKLNLLQELILSDKDLYHRIIYILRMETSDQLMFFNNKQNVTVKIIEITKRDIKFKVLHKDLNKNLKPKITILVSILKREAFEEAIYFCVELGANVIQPIITQKVHFKKWEDKERERLKRIIVSAAEQSKNFNFPELKDPVNLPDYLDQISKTTNDVQKIFFDAHGQNLSEIANNLKQAPGLILLIGPEGDLTPQEKEIIKKADFQFIKLTPTILRAQTAVSLALGVIRTLT